MKNNTNKVESYKNGIEQNNKIEEKEKALEQITDLLFETV